MGATTETTTSAEAHEPLRQDNNAQGGAVGGTLSGPLDAILTHDSVGHAQGRLLLNHKLSHRANSSLRSIAFQRAQQSHGNRFVQRALNQHQASSTTIQRDCACGGTCQSCRAAISPVSPASDIGDAPGNRSIQLQAALPSAPTLASSGDPLVAQEPGKPLDERPRQLMESRFGRNFSDVRIHTDDRAAESADMLNANAFTSGRDVYFGTGKYQPESSRGQHLLAHELTHTVQQAEGRVPDTTLHSHEAMLNAGATADPLEKEADHVADAVVAGATIPASLNAESSGVAQSHDLIQRDPTDPFAGKSYDLKTNEGVLAMAQDWQTQFIQDWSSAPKGSKQATKAGRAMAIYTDHFLKKFRKLADEGAKPSVLMQEVLAGINRATIASETETESKQYMDVKAYRTWFPEHYSAEYFEEARKFRAEQQKDFAINEHYKLQYLSDEKQYLMWAGFQYWQGFLADMLDEEGLRILKGQWDVLLFKELRLIYLYDAGKKSEARGKEEFDRYRMLAGFPSTVKEQLQNTRYSEITKQLADLVALKKGILAGTTPAEQEPWINGRIDELVIRLNTEFGIQMDRSRLLESVVTGKELRVIGGRIQRLPEGNPYFGQRMEFRAVLDYLPPGKTVKVGWRWKTDRENLFYTFEKSSVTTPVLLEVGFWNWQSFSIKQKGGFEVLAHIYVGDEDKPTTTLTTGWLATPEEVAPTEVNVLDAPEKTVQGAPVTFKFGPTIPQIHSYSPDWYVDDELKAPDFWVFTHKFDSTGDHTVQIKLSKVERSFGINEKTPYRESPKVKVNVLDATKFGESILSQMDSPLLAGTSPGSLKQLAASTDESIRQLQQKVAMAGDDKKYWQDRLESQEKKLKKLKDLVPELEQTENLPADKLKLETGKLYSGPISAVLIHPEKGVTLPLAMYLTVKGDGTSWTANLLDATSSKVLRFSGTGDSPQSAYVDAFGSWQSKNEYPTGGRVVYRFDPVVFKGSGGVEQRSFSTTTPWKSAKEWWDNILTIGSIIVGGLLLLAPEATFTKALGLALLAAATARSVIAIKERIDIGYEALSKENILDGIAIAASVTGIGGAALRSAGLKAVRPLVTQVGTALIITSAAADVGTFLYVTAEAISALRTIEADPTLDEAQKQTEFMRVVATLFMSGAMIVLSNKDLIKGKLAIKEKLELSKKVELDSNTRLDMELELKATGEHESFLKSVEGMDQPARDRALVERLMDIRARAGLKPTEENVRRVEDPKYSADYDAEMTVAEHTYRRDKKTGRWCRFSNGPSVCVVQPDINSEVDAILAKKPVATPGGPPELSIEAITTDPGPQIAPKKAGGPAGALPPGMPAHKEARWKEYQERGGTWSYERWGELYDRSIQAKRAEGLKEVADLKSIKDAAESRGNDLQKKAKEMQERAAELDHQAAIAKGDKQADLRKQGREARDAADQAKKDAEAAFREVVEAQLKIQRKNAQLNLDARSRLPCFAAGTHVWTPAGPCPIETLKQNDIVLAHDSESGCTVERRVLEIYRNQTMSFYHIEVNGSTIRSTSLHRFWVESEGEWIETRNLRAGMQLRLFSGKAVPIASITRREAPFAATYNLHVETSFTYFVGAGLLVHNDGPSYSFGNLRIYAGYNPDFPDYVYIGQTDDLVRRQQEHREEAEKMLKRKDLTMEQREFWEFKKGIILEQRVEGLNGAQANYLEQTNMDIEKGAVGEKNLMNRREQVARKNLPALEKQIMEDPAVKAAGLCP